MRFRLAKLHVVVVSALLWACAESPAKPSVSISLVSPGVAYSPRGFAPGTRASSPTIEQVVLDLRLLRDAGFRSLVTYGASEGLGRIPEIARRMGFDGLIIMGIWDASSDAERIQALHQASFVDGYCVGNESLGIRHSPGQLAYAMGELRAATGRPVTTSERVSLYLEGEYRDWLFRQSDWLFPTAHAFWAHEQTASGAIAWTAARYDLLSALSGKPVILKEGGFPTAGHPNAGEDNQLEMARGMEATGIPFFFFEAFDQPWKRDVLGRPEVETTWGLFTTNGRPKRAAEWIRTTWAAQ